MHLASGRDGVLYVPTAYDAGRAWPLLVLLHGAGGAGSSWASYPARAETEGFVMVAPDSRGATWDLIASGVVGPDLRFLDAALGLVFSHCRIDPERIGLAGFSDGASYGLSLGLSNGDLFSRVIGFSPGLVVDLGQATGRPEIFISHGQFDAVLPALVTREQIVPALASAGYRVTYREFPGGHEVPSSISAEAVSWFLAR